MKLFSSLTNRIFFASALLAVLAIGARRVPRQRGGHRAGRKRAAAGGRGSRHAAGGVSHDAVRALHARGAAHRRSAEPEGGGRHERRAEPFSRLPRTISSASVPICSSSPTRRAACSPKPDACACRGTIRRRGTPSGARPAATRRWRCGAIPPASSRSPPCRASSAPELVGTVSVGFSLDEEAAARFKALTNSEIAFAVGDEVQASTLPARIQPAARAPRGRHERQPDHAWRQRLRRRQAQAAIDLVGRRCRRGSGRRRTESRSRRRSSCGRGPSACGSSTSSIASLAGTAILAVLAATLLSYAVARTVTRPLGTITATMREMASTGDLTRKITLSPNARWEDEDARLLATTFNTMTDSIARFQREAAQRERLSSLGRLSTVVAHEIRNPLMIIKTALRTLKQRSRAAAGRERRRRGHRRRSRAAQPDRVGSPRFRAADQVRARRRSTSTRCAEDAARAVSATDGPGRRHPAATWIRICRRSSRTASGCGSCWSTS